jgi:FkbM family methyltransferase
MNPYIQQSLKGIYRFITNSNERRLFRLSLRYGNSERYKPKRMKFLGSKFLVPDCQSFIWQFKEIFVEEYYKFESANEAPVILDCGANIGTSCVYFKRLYPKAIVIAFEANPKIAEVLKENLRTNNFSDIEIVDKAVWIHDQGVELGIEDADASSIHKEDNKVKVGSIRLKNFLDKFEQVDMLKIDIEGAELEVLKDCRKSLSNVKNLFVEFHSFTKEKQNLSEVINILEENNFRYYIKSVDDRSKPLVNRKNKSNPEIDLQLNIFAYRAN